MAAEIGSGLIEDVISSAYPFGGTWQQIQSFLGFNLGPTPVGTALTSATRALDRRMLAASRGAREGATALVAAIRRAEDFIYIETPAFDNVPFGAEDDRIDLWAELLQRMNNRPSLCVAICTPVFLMPGAPAELQRVRDELIALAQAALLDLPPQSAVAPTRAERFVLFSPAAGPGRALRLASTTVVVDDAFAMTGTTHLWRRGLSFDSSYAVAVFDDRTQRGRPQEVVAFRQALMAGALGLVAADLPDDPPEVIAAIRALVERGGVGRLAADRIRPPDPALTTVDEASAGTITDRDIWNPDGSFPDFDPFGWLLGLRASVYDDVFNPPAGSGPPAARSAPAGAVGV